MIKIYIDIIDYSLKSKIAKSHLLINEDKIIGINEILEKRKGENPVEIFNDIKYYRRESMEYIDAIFFIENYFAVNIRDINVFDVEDRTGMKGRRKRVESITSDEIRLRKRAEEFLYKLEGRIEYFENISALSQFHKNQYNIGEEYIKGLKVEKRNLFEFSDMIRGRNIMNEINNNKILNEAFLYSRPYNEDVKIQLFTDLRYGQEIEYFNNIKTSVDVPFVAYGDLYKYYDGDMSIENKKKFYQEIPKTNIVFYLRVVKSTDYLHTNFAIVTYNINNNELTFEYNENIDKDIIIPKIEKTIGYKIRNYSILRLKKFMNITDIIFNKNIMFHIITNEPILSNYIYVDESQKKTKERLKFHIKIGERLVKINFSKNRKTLSFDIDGKTYIYGKKRYINDLNITDIKFEYETEDIINILNTLITKYYNKYDEVKNFYKILDKKIEEKEKIFIRNIPQYKIKDVKISKIIKYSKVDPIIQTLFQQKLYIYSFDTSLSSMIYCLCEIYEYENPEYTENKEEYVKRLRKAFAEDYYLTFQENFKYIRDPEILKNNIKSTDVFFDSKLYYRILEIYFGVNIFVIEGENFEIPYHDFFHSRQKYNQSIILYRDNNIYSIITKDKNRKHSNYIFNIYDIFIESYKIRQYNPNLNMNLIESIEYKFNDWILDSQILDSFGKSRVLIFRKGQNIGAIQIEPSYIRNVPIVNSVNTDNLLFQRETGFQNIYTSYNIKKDKNKQTLIIYDMLRTFLDLLLYVSRDKYKIRNNMILQQNTKYKIIKYPYYIPRLLTYDDTVLFITSHISGLFDNGKMLITNNSLMQGLSQYIEKEIPSIDNINIKYLQLHDFTQRDNEILVYGNLHFQNLLFYKPFNTSVSTKLYISDEPYIYTTGGSYYIIQQTYSIDQSKNLLSNWVNYKINTSNETSFDPNDTYIDILNFEDANITNQPVILKYTSNTNTILYLVPLPLDI
jgi:hypothetical protein